MERQPVAVIGAAGYSGEELLRILFRHPNVTPTVVTSRQYVGTLVSEVFPRFSGRDLTFSEPDVKRIADSCRIVFLALPHGLAAEYAIPLLEAGLTVIDISADFRLRDAAVYQKYYKTEHPAPELLKKAVYGLPEAYRDSIRKSNLIASPGCYCTSVILPSIPLLRAGLVATTGIAASCMSGVSGAGRKVELPYLFPECNESLRAYAVTGHRHLPEIEQELAVAAGLPKVSINFIPHLVPVNRGIASTLIFDATPACTPDAVSAAYATYATEPFVRVLPKGKLPDTKNVTLTNVCEIGYAFDDHTGRFLVFSAIDNLTKGASGQAVQSMNIRCGFEETAGLL
jgi:N-acetyl-gamma-glutamyl-phosphate reductase